MLHCRHGLANAAMAAHQKITNTFHNEVKHQKVAAKEAGCSQNATCMLLES